MSDEDFKKITNAFKREGKKEFLDIIIKNNGISKKEAKILSYLISAADINGVLDISKKNIASKTGVSYNSVTYTLQTLKAKGYISKGNGRRILLNL